MRGAHGSDLVAVGGSWLWRRSKPPPAGPVEAGRLGEAQALGDRVVRQQATVKQAAGPGLQFGVDQLAIANALGAALPMTPDVMSSLQALADTPRLT